VDLKENKILLSVLIILIGLTCIGVLKNISYPLLWNDEAECVMHGKRVIEFGYPKVHDGKNTIYPMRLNDQEVALDKKTDAYIGIGWSMFYFSTIGILLAENTDDIYTKTALLRLPFAILGLIGLAILAMAFLPFIKDKRHKLLFLILYCTLCLLSVSLLLHIREARYYSLVIFLGASSIYLYLSATFTPGRSYKKYFIGLIIVLLLLFNTHVPVFFIVLAYLGLHEGVQFFVRNTRRYLDSHDISYSDPYQLLQANFRHSFKIITPMIISFILIIPLLIFFDTFHISSVTNKFYRYDMTVYFEHLFSTLKYFTQYELLVTALVLKVTTFMLKRKVGETKNPELKQKLRVSNFISGFFVFYIIIIASFPSYIYTRYIVLLLPVLCIIISLEALVIFDLLGLLEKEVQANARGLAIAILCPLFVFNSLSSLTELGRVYEIFNQYKGPLDYIIPFIKSSYPDTENLVIAVNYEECAYMYYLDSKVTFGFILNNLEEDEKILPDIIIYRKDWVWNYGPEMFSPFLKKASYQKVSFPVYDYPTNTIPDLQMEHRHLYKTKYARNEGDKAVIYIKNPDS